MTDELTPDELGGIDHRSLTDDELVERLHDHRKGSGEWAAAFSELEKRRDRLHANERFQEALRLAEDTPAPPAEGSAEGEAGDSGDRVP